MKNMLDELFAKAQSANTTDFPLSDEELVAKLSVAQQPSKWFINKGKIKMTSIAASMVGALVGVFALLFTNSVDESIYPTRKIDPAPEQSHSHIQHSESFDKQRNPSTSHSSHEIISPTTILNRIAIGNADTSSSTIIRVQMLDKGNALLFGIEMYDDRIVVPFETIFGYSKFEDDLTEFVDLGYPRYTIADMDAVFNFDVDRKNQFKPRPYTPGRQMNFARIRPLFSFEKYYLDSDLVSCEPNRLSRNLYNEWPESRAIFRGLKECSEEILTAIYEQCDGNLHALGIGCLEVHTGSGAYPFAAQMIPVVHIAKGRDYSRLQIIWYLNDSLAEKSLKSSSLGSIYSFHTLDTCEALNRITMKNKVEDTVKKQLPNKDIFKLGELVLSDAELEKIGLSKTKYGLSYIIRGQPHPKNELDEETLEDLHRKGYDTTADTVRYRTLYSLHQGKGLLGDTIRKKNGMVSLRNYGFVTNELEDDSIVEFSRAYPSGNGVPAPLLKFYHQSRAEFDPFDTCYFIHGSTIQQIYLPACWGDSSKLSLNPLQCIKNAINIRIVVGDTLQTDSSVVDFTEVILWYRADESFANLLPERYRDRILRELEVQGMVDAGAVQQDSVCSMLNYDQNILGMCGNHSGALSSLSAMPNPVRDVLRMKFSLTEPRRLQIMLLGTKGELAREFISGVDYREGEVSVEEDISSLKAGLYFLVIVSDRGEQIYVKLIKDE